MNKRKVIVSIAMVLTIAINSIGVIGATTYSEDEIEKRITEVGEEYLNFYRDNYGENVWSSMNMMTFDACVEEEAFTYTEPTAGLSAPKAEIMGIDYGSFDTEEYSPIKESGFISVETQPMSTFGADVDTASYSSLRRKLLEPFAYEENPNIYGIDDSAIRIEEMMNYFNYHYEEPEDGEKFGVTTYLTKCPWNEDTLLFKVGIKAEMAKMENEGSNIVFLVDTSGSMFDFDKLPLVKKSLEILLENLGEKDRISIVTYAGDESVALDGANGDDKAKIMRVINELEAGGSTWGEGGINKAYEIAEKYFIEGGNNRVILCTDGDFNVGVSSEAGLEDLISKKRDTGVFFSCLGFGSGNYSDTIMETLADNGNGNYFYIDSEREAERALNEEFTSTIYTIAKDTKFQVEFNPANVKGYRLIGYENREMAAEDFANDKKDGGEVGQGQCVTVLYEIVPTDSRFEMPTVSSKYAKEKDTEENEEFADELLTVNIRYKEPDEDESTLREYAVLKDDIKEEMDEDTSWAAGIAQAGMLMRDSEYKGTSTFDEIYNRLKFDSEIMDNDYKAEFLYMLRIMKKYKQSNELAE